MSESEQGTEICDVISILNFKVKTECLCSVSPTELMRAKVLKFFYEKQSKCHKVFTFFKFISLTVLFSKQNFWYHFLTL